MKESDDEGFWERLLKVMKPAFGVNVDSPQMAFRRLIYLCARLVWNVGVDEAEKIHMNRTLQRFIRSRWLKLDTVSSVEIDPAMHVSDQGSILSVVPMASDRGGEFGRATGIVL